MTERECADELVANGWAESVIDFRKDGWVIAPDGPGYALQWEYKSVTGGWCLRELLRATMPGSAGITVAAYFGLRNPGVG